MDELFDVYSDALPARHGVGRRRVPGAPRRVADGRTRRAVKAKALDLLRGLLPAASLSHMGIYATGQTYEQLILHLLAHPLPEARALRRRMILDAVKAVMPSFVSRVERPDRGGEWVDYLRRARAAGARWVAPPGPRPARPRAPTRPSVRLLHVDGDEDHLLAALLFEAAGVPEDDARDAVARARRPTSAPRMLADLVGERAQPPPPPGPRASRRCATASRSSPTTAPSATCSATACSPCSGRR